MEWIYFEGGEPFLYYPILLRGVYMAAAQGFKVGIVSNAFWAVSVADASEWLRPMAGRLSDFTVSSDLYHGSEAMGERPQNALVAAKWLNIPTGLISVSQPEKTEESDLQSPESGEVMYRGRAAEVLAGRAALHPWQVFDTCPHEDLRDPGRIHVDPLGNLHLCQGVLIGNLFEKPLKQICAEYDPQAHPICGTAAGRWTRCAGRKIFPRSRGCLRGRMPLVLLRPPANAGALSGSSRTGPGLWSI